MNTAILFQVQSFFILTLIYVGVYFRKMPQRHAKIMVSAIIWDIILILQIELTRAAVEKAVQVAQNSMLLNIHVSLAVTCVIFYLLMIYSGRKLLKGDKSLRSLHKKMGFTTLVLRTLVFITSFFAVAPAATV